MLDLQCFQQIYIYRPFVDFRNGIDGLCGIIQSEMHLEPCKKYLFIFCCRSKKKLKMLYWDDSGFVLWYKRLEEDRYRWPVHLESDVLQVDMQKLNEFLIGLNPWQEPHKKLSYSTF